MQGDDGRSNREVKQRARSALERGPGVGLLYGIAEFLGQSLNDSHTRCRFALSLGRFLAWRGWSR